MYVFSKDPEAIYYYKFNLFLVLICLNYFRWLFCKTNVKVTKCKICDLVAFENTDVHSLINERAHGPKLLFQPRNKFCQFYSMCV